MSLEEARVFAWHELLSTEPEQAADFYAHLLEAEVRPATGSGRRPYYLLERSGRALLGVMMHPDPSVPARWDGYVAVPDLDETLAKAARLGAKPVFPEPLHARGWGRFSYLLDPQGAGFGAVQLEDPQLAAPNPAVSWCELPARDGEAALAFYQELFGWAVIHEMPGSDTSPRYFILGYRKGDAAGFGGLYYGRSEPVAWRYYLEVERLLPVLERVRQGGGSVTMGPHDIPGGSVIATAADPWGVPFALHAPAR